ncbi:hypothetical protein K466DRAFT_606186 [Polyporus arcularius HHB13444]|uniref:F-box domain-containing protein n=1 Tax=Polyporus arcularius HHB13444 TaxID=1314778 RepID=A0A5C3NTP6_9APHY|nr:hypothetical protein K466DRAFT_606186 [Polyporus arcularius HHB13444]
MANRSISDVQDILYEVVPYLNPEYYADREEIARAQKTLLHCALTCRNFARPALNVLWSCLLSDKPLLKLLCTLGIVLEVETEGSASKPIYTYAYQGDLRAHTQWKHFQEYASQVRSITLDPIAREGSIWDILVPQLRGDSVLPALRKAILSPESSLPRDGDASVPPVGNDSTRGALWLISPSVHQLSVSFPERGLDIPMSAVQEIVELACRMTPDLDELRIRTPRPIDLDFLRSHERLRTIEIENVMDTDALEPISTLPRLEHLSLLLGGASSIRLTFDHVRVLVLKGPWPHLTSFLDETELPQLRSFSAIVTQGGPADLASECASCFATLSRKYTRLTTLHVKRHRPSIPFTHSRLAMEPALAGSSLSFIVHPLLALHELRDVSLLLDGFIFPYSSSDIQSFAESWPNLESFRLEFVTQEEERAGFESLVHFARNCPLLRALHLPEMELTRDALEGVAYPEGQHPHPLRELDVAQVAFPGGLDLSHEVIRFTQRVFPRAATPLAEAHPIIVTDEESGDKSRVV